MPGRALQTAGSAHEEVAGGMDSQMSGRRSHERYAVEPAQGGRLRHMREVQIERMEVDRIVVLSQAPLAGNDMVRLTAPPVEDGQPPRKFDAKVVECRPVVARGQLWHQVTLVPLGTATVGLA